MPKLRVRAHRDDDLRTRKIEIWKGRKKLTVNYEYSPVGDVFGFSLEGRRELLPTVPELLQIVDAKRLDRIGTIELIDLISRITLIDEITTIGEIGKITTIKDLRTPNLIINNDFETGDLTGWFIGNPDSGTVNVSSLKARHGIYSCRFICPNPITGAVIEIEQIQMGLRSDWLTELMCWWYCSTTGTKFWIGVEYDDGTVDDFFDTQAVIPFWRPMVADTFTAGKRVYAIRFSPAVDAVNNGKTFYLDLPTWVF